MTILTYKNSFFLWPSTEGKLKKNLGRTHPEGMHGLKFPALQLCLSLTQLDLDLADLGISF